MVVCHVHCGVLVLISPHNLQPCSYLLPFKACKKDFCGVCVMVDITQLVFKSTGQLSCSGGGVMKAAYQILNYGVKLCIKLWPCSHNSD